MKKQILTNKEIEKDIINALYKKPDISEASYKKAIVIEIIVACLMIVIEFFYRSFILWVLLALFIYIVIGTLFLHLIRSLKAKRVSINDYNITTESVKRTSEEHFKIRRAGKWKRKKPIDNYALYFDNDKCWRIPKDNYLWSSEYPMSDHAIFQSVNMGDKMIVVTKKRTGKPVMAYHTEFFEYKN